MLCSLGLYPDKAVGFFIMTCGSGFWINAMTNRLDTLAEIAVMILFFRELKDYLMVLGYWKHLCKHQPVHAASRLSIYSFLADVQWLQLNCYISLGGLAPICSVQDMQPRVPVSLWHQNMVKKVGGVIKWKIYTMIESLEVLESFFAVPLARGAICGDISMLCLHKADYQYQIC